MNNSFGAKVLAFFRPEKKSAVAGSLPHVTNWVSALVKEPFTGAWQRNMECGDRATLITNSAVFTCVTSIAQDIAKLPVNVMKLGKDGDSAVVARNNPINRLLQRPNEYQTSYDWLVTVLTHLLLSGQAMILKRRDARGVINALHTLMPGSCSPLIMPSGEVWYRIDGGANQMIGVPKQFEVPASEVIHHRTITIFHPLIGATPILAAGLSATMGSKIAANSSRFFENMSRASGVLTTAEKVDPVVAKAIKEMWESSFKAGEFGRTAVLSQGLKWEPVTINAVDAQLIEQLRWTIEDVARVFRFPGFMLGDTSKLTYRNSEQMQRTYYSGCLQPHIEALESRLTLDLELSSNHVVEFDLDTLLRTELDVRYEAYSKGLNSGFLTINEVRAKESMPPVEGGDKPHLQSQYVPLGSQTGVNPPAPVPVPFEESKQ